MKEAQLIVLRLVDARLEGQWMAVQPGAQVQYLVCFGEEVEMVPTGDVEWNDDLPAEVYVPTTRLDQWRTEHARP